MRIWDYLMRRKPLFLAILVASISGGLFFSALLRSQPATSVQTSPDAEVATESVPASATSSSHVSSNRTPAAETSSNSTANPSYSSIPRIQVKILEPGV